MSNTPDSPDIASLTDRLADELESQGWLTDPVWRTGLHAVPRHLFVPATGQARPEADDAYAYPIDLPVRPAEWWEAVYSNASIVTQADDGTADPRTAIGRFSSSVSAPDVVFPFLELLDPRDHDSVLEIGTGSGWTASLLAWRVGPRGQVVSVEVDPVLAEQAQDNIKAAGRDIEVIAADGEVLAGVVGTPFDRLHVACGVASIPYSWITALRPGGVAVLPYCPPFGLGSQLRLTALGDGHAVGRFHGSAGYMMMRSQRLARGRLADFLHHWDDRQVTTTSLDPRSVVSDSTTEDYRTYGGDTAVAAMAPGVRYDLCQADDDSGESTLWLRETFPDARESGSWALAEYVPDTDRFEIHQYGDRRLWDEVSDAYLRWCSLGRPERQRFGVTVVAPYEQYVWLDQPDHRI